MIALVLAAVSAGADAVPVLTIPRLVAERAKRDGKTVEVHGWMGICQLRGCIIYADRKSAEAEALQPDHSHWLSIGSVGSAFDDKAITLRGRAVVLRGRFDAKCLSSAAASPTASGNISIVVCADRVPEIQPDGPQSLIPVKDH